MPRTARRHGPSARASAIQRGRCRVDPTRGWLYLASLGYSTLMQAETLPVISFRLHQNGYEPNFSTHRPQGPDENACRSWDIRPDYWTANRDPDGIQHRRQSATDRKDPGAALPTPRL